MSGAVPMLTISSLRHRSLFLSSSSFIYLTVQEALEKAMKGRTTVVVAHR